MRTFIVCLLCAFLSIKALAQNEVKSIVGIIPFDYTEATYKKQAEQLQNIVTRVFNSNNRISLLDRSKTAAIQKELNLQKDRIYINGKTVKQNKAFGAQYIILGTLNNIEIEKSTFSGINPFNKNTTSNTTTSKCKINFTLQKIDVTTGEVNGTKVFDLATNGSIEMDNYKKDINPFKNAVQINAKKIETEVNNWVLKLFPPGFKFYGVEGKDKKGFPKFATIVGDNESHVVAGDLISVLEIIEFEFEGIMKVRKVEIAVLKVKELEGDIIKCAIVSGEKVIEEKRAGKNKLEVIKKDD